ncbi:hypothetical protein Syun_002584 [Stephania yunnanensis]|uniref:Lectin n=1 Tax=Stephania yunnanensis TaxID=152371 RepID=A0AAP0LJY9_9MAGN
MARQKVVVGVLVLALLIAVAAMVAEADNSNSQGNQNEGNKGGCEKPGSICEDPKFVGGDGLTFYFHGKKDRDFCLLSDPDLHINAHFIGRRNRDMKRDFTWVQSLGILFDSHRVFIGARRTSIWENSVDRLSLSFDGQPVFLPESRGAKWQHDQLSPEVNVRSVMPVLGGFKEFVSTGLFEADCAVAQFGRGHGDTSVVDSQVEYASMRCGSGNINGRGIVCKK